MILTKEQRKAVKRIYDRNDPCTAKMTYREFRRTLGAGYDCVMIKWAGIWIGIEKDGYTHS